MCWKINNIYGEQDTHLEIGCKSTTIPKDMKTYLNKQIEIRDNLLKKHSKPMIKYFIFPLPE